MKFFASIGFALLYSLTLTGQTPVGLVAHYSFDQNDDNIVIDETGNIANNGFSTSTLYDCGVRGRSIRLNGFSDFIEFESNAIKEVFGTEDFTISFYFKALNFNQVATQTILSKRADCSNDSAFAVRYTPATRNLNVVVSENAGFSTIISMPVNENRCWHHVVVMREGPVIYLFLDGLQVKSDTKPSRIDITSNDLPFNVGGTSCSAIDGGFEGFLDELRIYNRALTSKEIEELYFLPDQIANGFVDLSVGKDTVIYLGNSFQAYITNSCVDEFLWEPADGVSDPLEPEPVLAPTETTTYHLSFTDNFGCVATDSLKVAVIDPATLDCKPFLPKAFTPNDDGLNDTYGLDNPFAFTDFISLEIFDRWGGRIFFTDDPFIRWDGAFKGEPVNPDVFLYKVRYRCTGDELLDAGSFTVIR